MAGILKRDELRLYQLIWERFVASQMAPAVFDQTTRRHRRGASASRSARRGSVLKFAGFTAVYEEGTDDDAPSADGAAATGKGKAAPDPAQD